MKHEQGEDSGPIFDKTGLTGKYDFTLVFADQGRVVASRAVTTAAPPAGNTGGESATAGTANPTGFPDIFAAVEQQLGLKLVRVKEVPVEVLVIDRVNKAPTEN